MAVYAVTGKLGSGKGKAAIDQIRRYLLSGKKVATNCDLFLENLLPEISKAVVIRVPDKPAASDLYMIGSGNKYVQFDPMISEVKGVLTGKAPSPKLLKGFDESHNGALVLDECGSWLNTRNFQDKGRAEMLEWVIHARKYGWDIFFIMQNISQVDKQLRESVLEYVVRLNRLDRMKVPFLSSAMKLLTAGALDGSLPRLHIGVVRLGSAPDGLVADRWVFRGDDLNDAYNTTQVFSDQYPHGTHSLLSAWHLSAKVGVPIDFVGPLRPGRLDDVLLRPRASPPKPLSKHMTKFLVVALSFGFVLGAFGMRVYSSAHTGPNAGQLVGSSGRVYSTDIKVVGMMQTGKFFYITLSDGRSVRALTFNFLQRGWEAEIEPNVWVKG